MQFSPHSQGWIQSQAFVQFASALLLVWLDWEQQVPFVPMFFDWVFIVRLQG